jgi:release factor glutamine methyltransferase
MQKEEGLVSGDGDVTAYALAIETYLKESGKNLDKDAQFYQDGDSISKFFELITALASPLKFLKIDKNKYGIQYETKQDDYNDNEKKLRCFYEIYDLAKEKNSATILSYNKHAFSVVGVEDNYILIQESNFLEAIKKRQTGLPIAYITGHKEFYGYDFFVTPDVLIPKPDTEILVEKTLEVIWNNSFYKNNDFFFTDVCTGSGCVGISIALQIIEKTNSCPKVFLTDISPKALEIAKKNVNHLIPKEFQNQFSFLQGDLLTVFENKTNHNLIVSNPPYIPSYMVDELLMDGRNEPRLALDGDFDSAINKKCDEEGLAIIKRLIEQSKKILLPNGTLILETGEYNAKKTAQIAKEMGFNSTQIYKDLAEQLRVVKIIQN